jgi:VIT1/CCC1 family predicted Fe2+/Mn2+ transporter
MSDSFIYTVPQWFIFAAIIGMVYGWIEDKKTIRLIGAGVLIALGIFAIIVLSGDYFSAGKYLTQEELANQQLEESLTEEIPFIARLFPAYLLFVGSAVLAIPTIFFDLKNKKGYVYWAIITGVVALAGFFVIVGQLKYI